MLFAIAVMNAATGLASALILAPISFGADVDFLRRGAQGYLGHYPVHDFVFSPLAAIGSVPLTWLAPGQAAIAWSLIEVGILLTGLLVATRGLPGVDRLLIAIAVLGFLPVVNELLLGQVTVVIAAGLYPVVSRDGPWRGVALGVVLALVPKPLLIPVLVWMLLWRRRALAVAVATALAITVAGIALAGLDAYRWWLDALVGAGEVTRNGNMALSALPAVLWAVGAAATVLAAGWAVWRAEAGGLVVALLAGLLLAPYTLLYALTILLVGVRTVAEGMDRRAAGVLAISANLALIAVPIAWMGSALAAVMTSRLVPGRTFGGVRPIQSPR